jgi:hypothetical protein
MGQGLQNHALANGEKIARMKGTVMSTFPQALGPAAQNHHRAEVSRALKSNLRGVEDELIH